MRCDSLARTGAFVLIALSGCRSQPAASPSGIADLSGYVVDVREGYGLTGVEIGPVFDPVRTAGIRQLRIRVASGVRSAPGTVAYIGVDPVTEIVHPGSTPVGGAASDLQGTFVRVWFRGRPRRSTPVETVAMARLVAVDSTAEAMTAPLLSAADSALVGSILLAEDRRDSADAALSEGTRHADERIRSLARRAALRIRDEHAAPRDSMPALSMPMTWAEPSWKAAYRALAPPTANCDALRAAVRDGAAWPVRLRAADLVTPTCAHDDSLAMTLRGWVDALPADASRHVRGDVSWHAAAHGLVALARMRPADARPRVAALATHGQWQVRAFAARAAGVLADAPTLRRLARDSNANVQEAAIVSLARVTGHADDTLYLAALAGPGAQAVRAAAVALKQSPRPDVASTASATFDRWVAHANASERDVRVALLEAAGRPSTDDRPPAAIHQLPPDAVALALGADTRLRVRLAPSAGGGAFVVRLRGDVAPMMAARILALARSHYYDGTDWHRVEPDFVIQGGSAGSNEYVGYPEFLRDEVGTVPHLRGTVGMSTRGHDTGDAQWFVNLKDNRRLDRDYTVFAEVVEGMDVVDGILEGDGIATIEEVVPGPASHAPAPATSAAITEQDLHQRLFLIADDSMMGRESGSLGNYQTADYVASEFGRLGLEPAGENGTYFQTVPFWRAAVDPRSRLEVRGTALDVGRDFVPASIAAPGRVLDGAPTIYGGPANDTTKCISAEQAAGKVVVLDLPAGAPLRGLALGSPRWRNAVTLAVAVLDAIGPENVARLREGRPIADTTRNPAAVPALWISRRAAAVIFGADPSTLAPGAAGGALHGRFDFARTPVPYPARNVVAILRGSDAALRGQYLALTAHNDHVGYDHFPVDHDSIRAFNRVIRPMGADSPLRPPTAEEWGRIRAILDSLRRVNRPRLDSIRNGADDDGSGTVSILEIAEAMSRGGARPRRSILFVNHTGEEAGLLGSRWYTDHATVPIDSIVAEIDQDMVGRGTASDFPRGGTGAGSATYLEVIGARRLSREFGDTLEAANRRQPVPFAFDYSYDAPGHPLQYYCRADHYSYARYGIPSVALSRGEHLDYHQVTDEPQYISYPDLARVSRVVYAAAMAIADMPARPALDASKPADPHGQCRQ